ncbi:MAG: GTP-binding protein [Butyrivibrio sp.]
MEIPVFIVNGFLESGKTSFIKDTLASEDFNDGAQSLVIACEEGEEEYEESVMKSLNTTVVTVDSEEELTKDFFINACNKSRAERVFVEFNGMWKLEDFVDRLPGFMEVAQIITLVNAETYDMYLANMKQVMMEQYKLTEMVIFNRCTKDSNRASYRRSVKAVNGRAQVYFESSDGSSNEVEEILPFDVTKDEIVIADEDFGLWYMDAMDNPEKYEGKIIKTKAVVYKPKQYARKGMFAPGRFAMTCCVEDIRFIGFKCVCDRITEKQLDNYKDRDFINLTAKVKVEFCKEYRGPGVVLYAIDISSADKPDDDLVYFN